MALGGSTNAAVHIMALARRAEVDFALADLDAAAREVPVLVNIFPSGDRLMEDFYFAGGLPALMARIAPHLDLSRETVSGKTLGAAIEGAEVLDDDVIRPLDRPVTDAPALAVLTGNLAPDGAVIKPSAADPARLTHTGPAVVFSSMADFAARIDDPDLEVTADSVLVLQNAGPVGAPGMPEWGNLQIPKKLLKAGVRDMVRLSDARMSGTHYGTCVLHIAPESAVGGPLALVQDGDPITLNVPARRLSLDVDPAELERRRAAWRPPDRSTDRGWVAIHRREVTQAPEGCDFPVMAGGRDQPEPEIF
jgi:dihydroxy-acid dehydratase